jgi:hypothetical protein
VIAVVEVVGLAHAKCLCDGKVVLLVGEDALADGAGTSVVVVGSADEVAGIAFLEQFEDEAAGEDREVVGVWLDGGEYLANIRLALGDAFDTDPVAAGTRICPDDVRVRVRGGVPGIARLL